MVAGPGQHAVPVAGEPLDAVTLQGRFPGYPAAGGRVTRWRTLLRSDELTGIPRHAQEQLLELGVRQVIDLRWPEELEQAPNAFRQSARVRYLSVPLLADDPTPGTAPEKQLRHCGGAGGPPLATRVDAAGHADCDPVR